MAENGMMFQTITDLMFSQIDAGYEVGIPGHPDDWPNLPRPNPPKIERIPAKKLITRSIAAELAIAEKLKGKLHE
jgi:hypothetical protein